jgi:hypothetical protein
MLNNASSRRVGELTVQIQAIVPGLVVADLLASGEAQTERCGENLHTTSTTRSSNNWCSAIREDAKEYERTQRNTGTQKSTTEIEDARKDENTHTVTHAVEEPRTLLDNIGWRTEMKGTEYPDLIFLSPAQNEGQGPCAKRTEVGDANKET